MFFWVLTMGKQKRQVKGKQTQGTKANVYNKCE